MGYESVGKTVSGEDALLAAWPAAWWRRFHGLMRLAHPGIRLLIVQAKGDASASAGTHDDGWAIDLQTWHLTAAQIETLVAVARRYGGVAWYRTRSQGFRWPHIHIAVDSGGLHTACRYQVAAARAGYSGLGRAGRGSRDTHPAPSGGWVTVYQGCDALARAIAQHTNTPPQEDDMPLTQDDLTKIAQVIDRNVLGAAAGSYGSVYQMLRTAADGVGTLNARTAPVRRGGHGDPNEYVAINQEIADAKTLAMGTQQRLDTIEAQVAKILELLTPDRAAQ